MCVNPININLGRTRYFDPSFGLRNEAIVPCGNCIQCSTTNKNDLYVRCLQEFNDCVSNGGLALFVTFTYDEDHVPYMSYFLDPDGFICLTSVDRSYPGDNVLMTFNKRHMVLCMKSVRKYFDSHFNSVGSIRFICVPEYGSSFTQRPHYHCIFFINNDIVSKLYHQYIHDSLVDSFLLSVFDSFWPHGMVSASDLGLRVNSESCLSYVTKYVCKNLDLLSFSRFSKFFDFICDCFNTPGEFSPYVDLKGELVYPRGHGCLACPFGHDFRSPMSYFLYYCKFFECSFYTVKSIGFGLSLKDSLPLDNPREFVDTVNLGIGRFNKHTCSMDYLRYPRYVIHHCLYNTRSDGTYYLNDFGLQVIMYLQFDSILQSVNCVNDFDWNLVKDIPLCEFADSFHHPFDPSDIPVYCSLIQRFSLPLFAYSITLRGLFVEPHLSKPILDAFNMFFRSTLDYGFNSSISRNALEGYLYTIGYYTLNIFPCSDSLPLDSPCLGDVFDPDSFSSPSHVLNNYIPFDTLLDFWTFLTNYFRCSMLYLYRDINSRSKLLSDYINSSKYGIS